MAMALRRNRRLYGLLNIATETLPGTFERQLLADVSEEMALALHSIAAEEEAERHSKRRAVLEEQLRQTQKMEALGVLAGGIAHDFNNMLSGIVGYTGLAMDSAPDHPRVKHCLERVMHASTRATGLVRQILSFSRRTNPELRKIDLGPMAKEAVKFLRCTLPASVQIRQHVQTAAGLVEADPTQFHQVIMNLCTNAVQAMSSGGVLEVTLDVLDVTQEIVSFYQHLTPGPYVRLRVADTGPGMDQETAARIFEPFYTTKPEGQGTGLGLSVVHGIVRAHGGDIRVQTAPGEGAVFEVCLPLAQPQTDGAASVDHSQTAVPHGTGRILLVDDERPLAEMSAEMAEALGYTVSVQSTSDEALHVFIAEPDKFDLLLTDHDMPSLTGVELAARCRAVKGDLPVVLCTGYSQPPPDVDLEELGVRKTLLKPFSSSELAEAIQAALSTAGPAELRTAELQPH
jgi:signal transduction histidine kinase/ActR/RegA family two-component response regulator